MYKQLVLGRIDVWHAAVMALEVQPVRRDRTLELMQRRHGSPGPWSNILVRLEEDPLDLLVNRLKVGTQILGLEPLVRTFSPKVLD